MEKIQPGKHVSLVYDLYDLSGKEPILVHQSDPEDPEQIIFGVTPGVIKPLEDALEGLSIGDTFDFVAESPFGEYDKEQIVELDKELFCVDGKFQNKIVVVGRPVPMMTADGYRINPMVLDIGKDKVKLDFNHPMAGKPVQFKGSVLDVRDATDEEIHMASNPGGCCGGCGGNGGCGGGCGDSDDASGCGCDGGCGCGK